MGRLEDVARTQDLNPLHAHLCELQDMVRDDLAALEQSLAEVPQGTSLLHRASFHLLNLGGKRLRPLCVLLATRLGNTPLRPARDLAVAVELVHSATLLHDDVVDLGEQRRGAPAARLLYGNAVSIFAGDWLLIEAIRRVRAAHVPGLLDGLLDTIDEMLMAEALQLAGRGRINTDRATYFRVIEGKTAALFRWALGAGGRAAGLPDASCQALSGYGINLGVAFQIVDDLLDLAGDERRTGKTLLCDLREGKTTYPMIVALERDPALLPFLEDAVQGRSPPETLRPKLQQALTLTGARKACLDAAREHVRAALRCLDGLPAGPALTALHTVAEAAVERDH